MANFVSRNEIIDWIDSIGKSSVTKEEIIEWVDSVEYSISKKDIDDWIVNQTYCDVDSFLDGFEDAFIGLVTFPGEQKCRALYDEDKCAQVVMGDLGRKGEDEDDYADRAMQAADDFSYTTMRALGMQKNPPGFLIGFNANIISEG